MKKGISTIFILSSMFLFSFSVKAQIKPLTSNDKAQIIRLIFKKWNFRDSENVKNAQEITVYLSDENISAAQIPKIKDVKFVTLTNNQIDEMKKTGVEYYSLSEFESKRKSIRVSFGINYFNFATGYSADSSTDYICYKVSGKWKVKEVGASASVGESF